MIYFSISVLVLIFILLVVSLLFYITFKNSDSRLVAISIIPEKSEIEINKKQKLSVVAQYSDGSFFDITKSIKWTLTDMDILKIDESGFCVALKEGHTEVCVMYRKLTSKAFVNVKA